MMGKFTKAVAALLFLATLFSTVALSAKTDADKLRAERDSALNQAKTYLSSGNFAFVYRFLCDYADATAALGELGEADSLTVQRAVALRDSYAFTPVISLTDQEKEGIFFGSDGAYVDGASAVKIPITFGFGTLKDYLCRIPATANELMVLVSLNVDSEREMRYISFGRHDEYIIDFLRTLASVEGRLYLSFSPAVNARKYTRTLRDSFISAYRHVADLARRYAPNVSLVFTLGDVRTYGIGDAAEFFPGEGYVDAVGVEVCHTYPSSAPLDPRAALDCRGEYYSPLTSVRRTADELRAVCGEDMPLIVESVSFPWDGRAAVEDPLGEMERFYRHLPTVCDGVAGVFYSNESSSYGICNLRQNGEAARLYSECAALPHYKNYADGDGYDCGASDITSLSRVKIGEETDISLWCGSAFGTPEYRVFHNGADVTEEGIVFTPTNHRLQVYVTNTSFPAVLTYSVTVTVRGDVTASPVPFTKHDFNGNGILDFGDAQYLTALIAGWNIDVPEGADPDVNGDGRKNLTDAAALRVMMAVPAGK